MVGVLFAWSLSSFPRLFSGAGFSLKASSNAEKSISDLLVIGGVPEGVFGVVGFQNLQLERWESVLGFDCSFDCLSS